MIEVIMNADDFGMSMVFNEKILDLLGRGFMHSTTVLVNRVTEKQDAQIKRLMEIAKKNKVSIGLHLDIELDQPLREQLDAQYKKFNSIFGFSPSHVDIHIPSAKREAMNARCEEIESLIDGFALSKGIPYRNHGKITQKAKHTTEPVFICTELDFSKIAEYVRNMKDGQSHELLFHPGEHDPNNNSSLNSGRKIDYDNVIKFQELLKTRKDIRNISYYEL